MYAVYTMQRTQIYLAEEQSRLLEARAKSAGTTRSALIRDAIDAFLADSSTAQDAGVQRFRSLLAEASGVAPYLPDGSTYVDELRVADSRRAHELSERRGR